MTNPQAEQLYDDLIDELAVMKAKIETDYWQNKEGKRSVLTGIGLCIEKIKRKKDGQHSSDTGRSNSEGPIPNP